MKKTKLIIPLMFILMLFSVNAELNSFFFQDYTDFVDTYVGRITDGSQYVYLANSFTLGSDEELSLIKLYMTQQHANSNQWYWLEIRETSVTGSVMGSSESVFYNHMNLSSWDNKFYFDTPIDLIDSTEYYMIIKSNETVGLAGTWFGMTTSPKTGDFDLFLSGSGWLHPDNKWLGFDLYEDTGASSVASFIEPTPPTNSINNTQININVNCSSGNVTLIFNGTEVITNLPAPSDYNTSVTISTTYNYTAFCYDGSLFSDNISRTWIYDIIVPAVILNDTNAFDNFNFSNQNQYVDYMILNMTFIDDRDLFVYSVLVSDGSTILYNNSNNSISGRTYSFYDMLNSTTWDEGEKNTSITLSDSHTKYKIKNYSVSKFINELSFLTTSNNLIKVKGLGATSSNYKKEKSKYTYGFDYLTSKTKRTFVLESDKKIYYIPNSDYTAHFIVLGDDGVSGNWIDFQGLNNSYSLKWYGDTKVEITFDKLKKSKKIKVDSIGDLNTNTFNYSWYRGKTNVEFVEEILAGALTDYEYSISYDLTYIQDIDSRMFFNGSEITLTKSIFANEVNFTAEHLVNENFTGIANLTFINNITQQDNSNYIFEESFNQQIVTGSLNITFYSELDESLITENISIIIETDEETLTASTTTGNIKLINFKEGNVVISAFNSNYPISSMFVSVENLTAKVDFYMLNDTSDTIDVVYFIQDRGQIPVEQALLTFYKRFNNTLKIVNEGKTDSLGLVKFHLDTRISYDVIITAPDFPVITKILKPIFTEQTITLDKSQETIYNNVYENLTASFIPTNTVINLSNSSTSLKYFISDSSNSLEYYGFELIGDNLTCNPSSCKVNISNIPGGAGSIIDIIPNVTTTFEVNYFFKRINANLQYYPPLWYSIYSEPIETGNSLDAVAIYLKSTLKGQAIISIASALVKTVAVVIAVQFGIIGLALLLVVALVDIFLIKFGFLNIVIGVILITSSIIMYVFLSREK